MHHTRIYLSVGSCMYHCCIALSRYCLFHVVIALSRSSLFHVFTFVQSVFIIIRCIAIYRLVYHTPCTSTHIIAKLTKNDVSTACVMHRQDMAQSTIRVNRARTVHKNNHGWCKTTGKCTTQCTDKHVQGNIIMWRWLVVLSIMLILWARFLS